MLSRWEVRLWNFALKMSLDPEMAVLLKAAGLDFFFIDTEHSPANYPKFGAMPGRPRRIDHSLVRVTQNEPA